MRNCNTSSSDFVCTAKYPASLIKSNGEFESTTISSSSDKKFFSICCPISFKIKGIEERIGIVLFKYGINAFSLSKATGITPEIILETCSPKAFLYKLRFSEKVKSLSPSAMKRGVSVNFICPKPCIFNAFTNLSISCVTASSASAMKLLALLSFTAFKYSPLANISEVNPINSLKFML